MGLIIFYVISIIIAAYLILLGLLEAGSSFGISGKISGAYEALIGTVLLIFFVILLAVKCHS